MSDISDCIIKILADNGVSVKQTDIWKDNGSVRNVKNIIELDFSEHDKVFEDRIAELKKVYKTASELLGKYQQENEALEQRIAELESKESEKTMRIEFHADNGEMLTPLEVANSLINQNTFKVDKLRELSEFLQVYCNHHEDRDIEPSIMLF